MCRQGLQSRTPGGPARREAACAVKEAWNKTEDDLVGVAARRAQPRQLSSGQRQRGTTINTSYCPGYELDDQQESGARDAAATWRPALPPADGPPGDPPRCTEWDRDLAYLIRTLLRFSMERAALIYQHATGERDREIVGSSGASSLRPGAVLHSAPARHGALLQ